MTNKNNHVYILNTVLLNDDAIFSSFYGMMSEKRKNKIDSLRFRKDKNLSLGAGIILCKGLENTGADRYEIIYNENNKPLLSGKQHVFFNISHSGDFVVCAFSDTPVGIDIEKVQHFEDDLIKQIFSEDEISSINSRFSEPDIGFTELWTIKESIMKFFGVGLLLPPEQIYINFNEVISASCRGYKTDGLFFTQYQLSGYSITVCSEQKCFSNQLEWIKLP